MIRQSVGVLGVGEVGTAISQIFSKKFKVLNRDLKFDEINNSKIEVLHICLPYSDKFENIVLKQVLKSNPKLIIIHSTVKPGTTNRIFKKTKIPIAHSPVMGTHPNLQKDILTFAKIIGPVNKKSMTLAVNHLKSVGIKTKVFNNPLESEIAKILDTTYYGWNIIFAKLAWEICQHSGVDFDHVYSQFNRIYNAGYSESKPNVLRPILKYQPGPIGGHCIIPNSEILEGYVGNPISKFIIKNNSKLT